MRWIVLSILLGFIHASCDSVNTDQLSSNAIKGFLKELDPHSVYIPKDDFLQTLEEMQGKFEGIGARLTKRNQEVKIVEIISGGPLWRDKLLEVGDVILKVGQKNKEHIEFTYNIYRK